MPIEFYSPNKSVTGAALFVSFNSKEGYAHFLLQKQTGYNEATKRGVFKDGERLNFKLSPDEIGGIIHAVRTRGQAKFYHIYEGKVTSGQFNYYKVGEEPNVKRGFGLTLTKEDQQFKVGLSEAAAERLLEYMRFAFEHIFSAVYSADKKALEARQKEGPKPKPKPEPAKPAPQEDNAFDLEPPVQTPNEDDL